MQHAKLKWLQLCGFQSDSVCFTNIYFESVINFDIFFLNDTFDRKGLSKNDHYHHRSLFSYSHVDGRSDDVF